MSKQVSKRGPIIFLDGQRIRATQYSFDIETINTDAMRDAARHGLPAVMSIYQCIVQWTDKAGRTQRHETGPSDRGARCERTGKKGGWVVYSLLTAPHLPPYPPANELVNGLIVPEAAAE